SIEIGGGSVKDIGATVADGDYSVGHNGSAFDEETYVFLEDLGSLFWIDTMHFLTDGASALDVFLVDISDGTRAPDGSVQYTRVNDSSGSGNVGISSESGIRYREIRTAPSKVRYVRSTFANPLSLLSYVGFTEVMFYGAGYVPEVSLTSDLVLLATRKNLISIDWDADTPAGTRIQLQTRTGNELVEEKIYHDDKGNVVTESRYTRLPASKQGEISSSFEAGPDWSTWSVPYNTPGTEIASPSPRQYLQIRTTLSTDRADTAATLRAIVLNMSDPVATQLQGEIWPIRVGQVGVAEEFSLFVRPTFTESGQGFNELKVEATAGARMEFLGLRHGTDAQFESDAATRLAAADLVSLSAAADTIHVRLPQSIGRGTDLLEVQFRATILGNSASFRGFVRDTAKSEFWQRVDAGDATTLAASQTVTVLALEGSEVLGDFRLAQSVLTPNGDGINDELRVEFSVARVAGQRAVTLVIYDLSGRAVARVEELRPDSRGQYALVWDGNDAAGNLVSPGIYIARVDVAVDSDRAVKTSAQRAIYVAF
ncbi:MAG: gliding motility-associated C-terminal domain-containing protein, partial [bacterium]|nr:gliding motility-associated C-terminal domain-containing protein [bacterium]